MVTAPPTIQMFHMALSLSVPDSAVLDSGTRQLVLVQRGAGRFEPRAVKLGRRGDGYVEVLRGVKAGEQVVVSANFLIDAESNLKAALSGFGSEGAAPADPAQPKAGAAAVHSGEARVEAVDAAQGSATLKHGPIASLKWPAMTMDFKVRDPAVLRALKPGQTISFDMVGEADGDWVIVRAQPSAASKHVDAANQGR